MVEIADDARCPAARQISGDSTHLQICFVGAHSLSLVERLTCRRVLQVQRVHNLFAHPVPHSLGSLLWIRTWVCRGNIRWLACLDCACALCCVLCAAPCASDFAEHSNMRAADDEVKADKPGGASCPASSTIAPFSESQNRVGNRKGMRWIKPIAGLPRDLSQTTISQRTMPIFFVLCLVQVSSKVDVH